MGGTISHEFMVPAEIGEDKIITCSSCGYAASTEVAKVKEKGGKTGKKSEKMKEVTTPGVSTVEDVSGFLKVEPGELIKTLMYIADGEPVAVLIRGDHEANETKIKNFLKAKQLELADEEKVREITGGPAGFSGPVGLKVRIISDNAVKDMEGAVTGANKGDTHLSGVNPEKDFKVDDWFDARAITSSDPCPKCGSEIQVKCAIEIGHTFKLGTKYSGALNAGFLDDKGTQKPVIMGCYGIGVNRILASLIEQSHDKDGVIWPVNIAPGEVVVIPVKKEDNTIFAESEKVYDELSSAGVDAILDDREKSIGVKFKDADLVGFPFQVIIGKKGLDQGKVEIKMRATGDKEFIDRNRVVEYLKGKLGG